MVRTTLRLIGAVSIALILSGCDKCGQPLLRLFGSVQADVCSSDNPKGS